MKRSSADAVLDATRDVVMRVGVTRTTLAAVARTAGLSRATVYTHFDDVDAAVAALLTRELGLVLDQAAGMARPAVTGRGQLMAMAAEVMRVLPAHPLFDMVVTHDAEVLVPYLVRRFGAVQKGALQVIDGFIQSGQADGSIRAGDPAVLAHLILLTVQSFVVSHRLAGHDVDRPQVVAAAIEMLDAGLSP